MANQQIAYDPTIIQAFATRLYQQASVVIFTSTLLGSLIGAFVVTAIVVTSHSGNPGTAALIGVVVGGLIGFVRGKEKAFKLKLDAQIALCQVQIEQNSKVK